MYLNNRTANIKQLFKLAVISYILFSSIQLFSQKLIDVDSLKIGKSYKVILYDDREITGKLISSDSIFIRINEEKNIYKIRRDDILSVSQSNIKTDKAYMLSIYGGYSLAPENYYGSSYGKKISLKGFNAGIDIILPLKDSRGVRLCLSYNWLKKPEYKDDIQILIYPPPGYSIEEESNMSLVSFRTDYLFGDISPANKYFYFFSAGPGFAYFHESAYTKNYIYNDTVESSNFYYEKNNFSILLALGISGGYKINRNISIQAQIEYNLFLYHKVSDRIKNGLIPIKLGLSYFF